MYQVELSEADVHIQYFWSVLESFSQEDLAKFVKFACNQERIPQMCPCRDGNADVHVPPYPMKIAPPDGAGELLYAKIYLKISYVVRFALSRYPGTVVYYY